MNNNGEEHPNGETTEVSKIILDVDKRNFKVCWGDKTHILKRVGVNNQKIPFADWKDFFVALEKKYGEDTPEMWAKLTYTNEVMRCYITPKEGGFQLTLKNLPIEIFGQKYKIFNCPTMLRCYEEAYGYVASKLDEENNPRQLRQENEQLKLENVRLKEENYKLLYILDGMSDDESEKAANELKKDMIDNEHDAVTEDHMEDGLEYFYDYEKGRFRKVSHFDDFNQPVLASKGFPFDDVTGIRIIKLYRNKGLTPQQIVNHIGLHDLNKNPKKTVENFLHVYNKGLLNRTIRFCCNNSHNCIDENPELLVKE